MKISKSSFKSQQAISTANMSPVGFILFSLIFLFTGTIIIGVSFGLINAEVKMNAPKEIVAIAGSIFFLAGLSVLIQGITKLAAKKNLEKQRRRQFNSPWLWDYKWNRRGIESRSQNSIIGHILGFSIVLGLWAITYWIGFVDRANFKIPFYVMSFFAILILMWFYTMISKRIRYGKAYLKYNQFPFKLGQELNVTFTGLPPKDTVDNVIVTLRYYEEYETKNSKNQKTISLKEVYQETKEYKRSEISSQRSLNAIIAIPNEEKYKSSLSSYPANFWEIQIQCEIVGWDYREYFLVPIY
ncbi:hypothetical protein [Halobacteriovorax sp. HLS]|uniref:hypothetical protein n=1 Tax=Halobacteriovorax sp. HLS TaxID=2234000 RepID=UPI000FD8D5AD|nr:hypothetical protein [Halobacteriovorax sp. HLS]